MVEASLLPSTTSVQTTSVHASLRIKMPPASKNYLFTLFEPFNLIDAIIQSNALPKGVAYLVCQKEKCPTTDRIHFQSFVQFERRIRTGIQKIQQIFGPCHVEIAKGTPTENKAYCTKDESRIEGPWELGTMETQGKRNDLVEFKEAIKLGKTNRSLLEEFPTQYIKYYKTVPHLRMLLTPIEPPPFKLEDFTIEPMDLSLPILLYGPSGIGKTNFALAHFKSPLLVTHLDQLADIRDDHDGLVFDDLSFKHTNFQQVINLLDIDFGRHVHIRYTTGMIPKGMKRIFCHNTDEIFDLPDLTDEQIVAIARRLRKVKMSIDSRNLIPRN